MNEFRCRYSGSPAARQRHSCLGNNNACQTSASRPLFNLLLQHRRPFLHFFGCVGHLSPFVFRFRLFFHGNQPNIGTGPPGGRISFGSVTAWICSCVASGANSFSTIPTGVMSITPSSVTMWCTTATPVRGSVHFF